MSQEHEVHLIRAQVAALRVGLRLGKLRHRLLQLRACRDRSQRTSYKAITCMLCVILTAHSAPANAEAKYRCSTTQLHLYRKAQLHDAEAQHSLYKWHNSLLTRGSLKLASDAIYSMARCPPATGSAISCTAAREASARAPSRTKLCRSKACGQSSPRG